MVHFGDIVESKNLDGDKKKLEDVLDKPIVLTGWKITTSKYANVNKGTKYCTKLQFYYQEDEEQTRYVLFTGSEVIRDQVEEMEAKLKELQETEVLTTIKKIGSYHSLT